MSEMSGRCPKCGTASLAEMIVPSTVTYSDGEFFWQREYRCPLCDTMECFIIDCNEKGQLYEGFFVLTVGEGENSETHKLRNDKFVCARHTMEIKHVEQLRRRATFFGITLTLLLLVLSTYIIVFKTNINLQTISSAILAILVGGLIAKIAWEVMSGVLFNADSYIKRHNLLKKQAYKQRLTAQGYPPLNDDWF